MEGTPFGRYRLLELLGRGGMGEVWRAHDTETDRVIALKLLPRHLADDEMFQKRFRREAHAAASLNEPHVVPIHNFGEIDGQLYVDMRLIEGRDLQTLLSDGPLVPARAVTIVEQVATALDAAHQIGLVHRDVKPSNILVAKHDFAYLIDFGIARAADQTGLTSTGSTLGTWAYMAPERFGTGQSDARADTYALACVLHECLTGRRPFAGESVEQQVAGHLSTPPPQPSVTQPGVSPSFDAVIAKGMAKNPDERYQTTLDLARAARAALGDPASQMTAPATSTMAEDAGLETVPSPDATRFRAFATPTQSAPTLPKAEPPPVPGRARRRPPRRAILVTALLAAVAVAAGVLTVAKLTDRQGGVQDTHVSKPAGPLDGTFTAQFGPKLDPDGQPYDGSLISEPDEGTWSIRSACRADGCVATASLVSGKKSKLSTLVFDGIGGRWVGIAVASGNCRNVVTDLWAVFSLQPRPDGTLFGEYSEVSPGNCAAKWPVTFTRTGDRDPSVQVADPDTQPPRVASPAQGLRGRYHSTLTAAEGDVNEEDLSVQTDCLRTGDRCMSYFHNPKGVQALVFASGQWTWTQESDTPCQLGGTAHAKILAVYPLPQPQQDPIAVLTGRGHLESTGSACTNNDFEDKFERTGD